MKKNRQEDERVRLQRLKIGSEALALVLAGLMISMLYKQLVLDASFSEYMTEFIICFGASVYIVIRNLIAGNAVFNGQKRLMIIAPLICGITVALVSFWLNRDYHLTAGEPFISALALLMSFLFASVGAFVVLYVVNKSNEKRAKKLEEKYDD